MSLSKQLQDKAQEILNSSPEAIAIAMLKQAGLSDEEARTQVAQQLMEKAAMSSLVSNGIDYDEALKLVKVANIKIAELNTFKAEKTSEEVLAEDLIKLAEQVAVLEEKAAMVDGLQEKVAELQDIVDSTPEVVEVPEPITKMAQTGEFTNEDLQALMQLPTHTLNKIASSQEEPWKMGKSAQTRTDNLDPFAAWLLS